MGGKHDLGVRPLRYTAVCVMVGEIRPLTAPLLARYGSPAYNLAYGITDTRGGVHGRDRANQTASGGQRWSGAVGRPAAATPRRPCCSSGECVRTDLNVRNILHAGTGQVMMGKKSNINLGKWIVLGFVMVSCGQGPEFEFSPTATDTPVTVVSTLSDKSSTEAVPNPTIASDDLGYIELESEEPMEGKCDRYAPGLGPAITDLDWSPDGQEITFVADDVYIIDVRSTTKEVKQITGSSGAESIGTMAWLPNGRQILYMSRETGLYMQDLSNGMSKSHISSIIGNPLPSPDGQHIILETVDESSGLPSIYIMNIAGTDPQLLPLISDGYLFNNNDNQRLSPDGKQFVYTATKGDEPDKSHLIFVAQLDEEGIHQLSPDFVCENNPAWSPDGQYIAFSSDRNGSPELFVMRPDGSESIQITNDPDKIEHSFIWSPNSQQIAYVAAQEYVDGENQQWGISVLYVVQSDGSRIVQLAGGVQGECCISYPAWSPDGKHLAFYYLTNQDCLWRECESHIDIVEVATGERARLITIPRN